MYEELVSHLRECAKVDPSENTFSEAADAIEELQQTVEHYKGCSDDWYREACDYKAALPRWIPVTERLPKEGEFVLVYGDFYPNKHDGGVIAVSKRMDWNYWQGFGRERNITHWMPLPEPPKEET